MAKKNINYQRTVQYLNKIYKAINEHYCDGKLEPVTVTIQSTVSAFGHCSVGKIWVDADGNNTRELNIAAEYLTRPIYDVVATMLHECTHIYQLMNGISGVSANGFYHNRAFKRDAEEIFHLKIDKHPRYGWTLTSATDDTIQFCIDYGFDDILTHRDTGFSISTGGGAAKTGNGGDGVNPPKVKKPSNSRRYVCPCCGAIVRSTRPVNIVCGDCNVPFDLT